MMILLRSTAIVFLLLASASPARAFGWRLFGSTSSYQTSYYAYPSYYTPVYYPATVTYYVPSAPVYVTPVVQCAPTVTVPVQPQPNYAQPTPAPPSQPPGAPKVQASHSLYRADSGTTDDVVRTGFWNVTNRNIALNVNGQSYLVPRGQMIDVNVPRQFSWQNGSGQVHSETIPTGQNSFEVVIRN